MKLLCLSPAEFIHFGTTRELRSLVTKDVQDYEFLDWKMQVNSAVQKEGFAAHNAYVGSRAKIGKEAYLENCYILGNSEVGDGTVLSHVRIMDRKIPEQIVMHGIELTGGKKVIRIYGVPDNPKGKYPGEVSFLGTTLNQFMAQNKSDERRNSGKEKRPICGLQIFIRCVMTGKMHLIWLKSFTRWHMVLQQKKRFPDGVRLNA